MTTEQHPASLGDYLHDYAVSPGDRTVVVTNNDDAYLTAIALKEAGLSVPVILLNLMA